MKLPETKIKRCFLNFPDLRLASNKFPNKYRRNLKYWTLANLNSSAEDVWKYFVWVKIKRKKPTEKNLRELEKSSRKIAGIFKSFENFREVKRYSGQLHELQELLDDFKNFRQHQKTSEQFYLNSWKLQEIQNSKKFWKFGELSKTVRSVGQFHEHLENCGNLKKVPKT